MLHLASDWYNSKQFGVFPSLAFVL